MVIIEITKPQTIKIVNRRSDNKQFDIPEQEAYVHMQGEPYPTKIVLGFERGQPGYPPGRYKLLPSSLYVDQNGNLSLAKAIKLEPIAVAAPQQKAA